MRVPRIGTLGTHDGSCTLPTSYSLLLFLLLPAPFLVRQATGGLGCPSPSSSPANHPTGSCLLVFTWRHVTFSPAQHVQWLLPDFRIKIKLVSITSKPPEWASVSPGRPHCSLVISQPTAIVLPSCSFQFLLQAGALTSFS